MRVVRPKTTNVHRRGFSLVELLIVIAIVGILTALVLVGIKLSQARSTNTKVKSGIHQLRTLMQEYHDANNFSYANFAACLATPTPATCRTSAIADNVTALKSDIETANKQPGSLVATSNQSRFCLAAPLASPTTTYFCADTSGTLTEGEPSGAPCAASPSPACSF